MNRLKLIFNLILGKDIVVYDSWHKEVLMIIGCDEEIFTKRYDYDFMGKNDKYLAGDEETGKIYFKKQIRRVI
jgi:hypothetical protein